MNIPVNMINRVFRIKVGNSTGTAFVIEVNNTQYLITARHLVEDILDNGSSDVVEVQHNDAWIPLSYNNLYDTNNALIDIAIIETNSHMYEEINDIYLFSEPLIMGQEMCFLGFPLGLFIDSNLRSGSTSPFAKMAHFSGCSVDEHGILRWYFDGHNNRGFSGGPIFCVTNHGEINLIGVVSGYLNQRGLVEMVGIPNAQLFFNENSGIIRVDSIQHTINEINRRHPSTE